MLSGSSSKRVRGNSVKQLLQISSSHLRSAFLQQQQVRGRTRSSKSGSIRFSFNEDFNLTDAFDFFSLGTFVMSFVFLRG